MLLKGLLLVHLALLPAHAEPVSGLIAELCSSNGRAMFNAANKLLHLEVESVPQLIQLLDLDQRIKPTTQPTEGWAMYLGHGGAAGCYPFLSYALNETQARAGWLLEDITFQDFGFQGQSSSSEPTAQSRSAAVARAKSWWTNVDKDSRRVDFLCQALLGPESSQLTALRYMSRRERIGPCPGLTEEYYRRHVHPIIGELMHSPSARVRESAATIWLRADQRVATPRFLAKAKLPDETSPDYELRADETLLKNGEVLARVGDPFSYITIEIPVTPRDYGGDMFELDTVPATAVMVTDGKITAFVATDERDYYGPPWEESPRVNTSIQLPPPAAGNKPQD